jgi:hypothetical protein
MTSASSLLKNSFAIARAAGYVDHILKGLVKKAKNPKQEDDWNWDSDQPEQYAFTHWSSPVFS